MTPKEVLSKVSEELGVDLQAKQVALAVKKGLIDLDSDGAKDILSADKDDSMLMVTLGNKGLISQLYRMAIEIIASDDQVPMGINDVLSQMSGYRVFTYLPDVEPMDIEAVRQYNEMIHEIMTKA